MSIEKASITTLHHVGATYAVIPSETINAIQSCEALAILTYLLDRAPNWIIRREDIMRRFGIGRDRHDKAMRELKALGLAWRESIRSETGQILEWRLCVSASPQRSEVVQMAEKPQDGKPAMWETPPAGKTDHLNSTDDLHITDLTDGAAVEPAAPADEPEPGPRKMRPDWQPSQRTIERAIELGLHVDNPARVLAEFKDYWIHTGKRRKADGWERTFLNRLKAIHDKNQQGNRYGQPKPTDLLAADLQRALAL